VNRQALLGKLFVLLKGFGMSQAQLELSPAQIEDLRSRVMARPWFHRMDLGYGIITPGVDKCDSKKHHYGLPERLDGLSVIDIGAYDGFWSFECERRGAKRVVAADYYCWTKNGRKTKEGFDLAHEAYQSSVESIVIPVEELSPETVGTFDIVLFLGVLYHAKNPMHYLSICRSICERQIIVETHVDALDYNKPAAVFYPGTSLNNDPSCFWGPNPKAVEGMLNDTGFRDAKTISVFRDRATFHAFV
jgi:tRNA (mo5U34)-methyltransferase